MTDVVWADAAIADPGRLRAYPEADQGAGAARPELTRLVFGADRLAKHPHAGSPVADLGVRKCKPPGERNLLLHRSDRGGIAVSRPRCEAEEWLAAPLGSDTP